jgi:multiple antibiotic resistance protein
MPQNIGLAFVTLSVAVDILGTLPLYLSLTGGLSAAERRGLPLQSTMTATAVGLGFLVAGDYLFRLLGVSVGDFQVAGGILLLILSVRELLSIGATRAHPATTVGVVPLGTPLIAGPAVLATLVILVQTYGYPVTLLAFVGNMLLAYLVLRNADRLGRVLGEAGSEAIAKVASLFLAAFGVSLIRRGLDGWLRG